MTTADTIFANILRPSVTVIENTSGYRVIEIASFSTTYIIGSASAGAVNTPTKVNSLTDFTNQFPTSPSTNSVRAFFRNAAPENASLGASGAADLYFVRVPFFPAVLLTVGTPLQATYSVTINGNLVATNLGTVPATALIACNAIASTINQTLGLNVKAWVQGTDSVLIQTQGSGTLTAPVLTALSTGLTQSAVTGTVPGFRDVINSIESAFDVDDNWEQGYLIAPEFFQNLTVQTERTAIALAMEQHCSSRDFDWKCYIDPGAAITTTAQLRAESQLISSPKGHADYLAPYLIDLENNTVPPSPFAVGAAIATAKTIGFQRSPANIPLKGALNVSVRYSNSDQDVLNPLGINAVRNLRTRGIVLMGARTRSSDPFYRFTHVRIIMNVINGTLRRSFDQYLFETIDSQGTLLTQIESEIRSVLRRIWRGGGLFGETENAAFEVVCSFVNNDADNLELGQIVAEVYAVPVPNAEKILILTHRVNIGSIPDAASLGIPN